MGSASFFAGPFGRTKRDGSMPLLLTPFTTRALRGGLDGPRNPMFQAPSISPPDSLREVEVPALNAGDVVEADQPPDGGCTFRGWQGRRRARTGAPRNGRPTRTERRPSTPREQTPRSTGATCPHRARPPSSRGRRGLVPRSLGERRLRPRPRRTQRARPWVGQTKSALHATAMAATVGPSQSQGQSSRAVIRLSDGHRGRGGGKVLRLRATHCRPGAPDVGERSHQERLPSAGPSTRGEGCRDARRERPIYSAAAELRARSGPSKADRRRERCPGRRRTPRSGRNSAMAERPSTDRVLGSTGRGAEAEVGERPNPPASVALVGSVRGHLCPRGLHPPPFCPGAPGREATLARPWLASSAIPLLHARGDAACRTGPHPVRTRHDFDPAGRRRAPGHPQASTGRREGRRGRPAAPGSWGSCRVVPGTR